MIFSGEHGVGMAEATVCLPALGMVAVNKDFGRTAVVKVFVHIVQYKDALSRWKGWG